MATVEASEAKLKISASRIRRERIPMKVFKFRCKVVEGKELIAQALTQYATFYNAMCDAEKEDLAARSAAIAKMVPGWQEVTDEYEALRQQRSVVAETMANYKSRLAYAKKNKKPTDELAAMVEGKRAQLKELKAAQDEVKERRKALIPEYEARFKQPNESYADTVKAKSLDRNGAVHGATLAKQQPKVLEAMATDQDPAWVEYHRGNLARKEQLRAIRRAGHTLTMTLARDAFAQARSTMQFGVPRYCVRGSGRVGVSVSPPLPLTDVYAGDVPGFTLGEQKPSEKRLRGKNAHVPAAIQIGDAWVQLQVIQHRPMPPDAKLCRVVLKAERLGNNLVHTIHLTVEHPSFVATPKGSGTVAVNFGWRKLPEGYQVAIALDDNNISRPIIIPQDVVTRLDHADNLISARDKVFVNFKPIRDRLFKERPGLVPPHVLAEVQERLTRQGKSGPPMTSIRLLNGHKFKWIAAAISKHHLTDEHRMQLWYAWRVGRKNAGMDLFDDSFDECDRWCLSIGLTPLQSAAFWIDTWRRKHSHLETWSGDVRRQALNRRKDYYRNVTRFLATVYGTVVVHKINFSKMARRLTEAQKKAMTPEEIAIAESANSHRFVAAPADLRAELNAAFGSRVVEVDGANISTIHQGCGGELVPKKVGGVVGTCDKCGMENVNLDLNACANELERAGVYEPKAAE